MGRPSPAFGGGGRRLKTMIKRNYEYKFGVEVSIGDGKFLIRHKLIGQAEPKDYEDFPLPHYVYEVAVRRVDIPSDEYRFIYHGSFNDLKKGKKRLSEIDLVLAFRMTLEDALAFADHWNVDDFARDYGIDKPSKAIKLWKTCQNIYEDVREKLKLTYSDIHDIVDTLIEWENEDFKSDKVDIKTLWGEVYSKRFSELSKGVKK